MAIAVSPLAVALPSLPPTPRHASAWAPQPPASTTRGATTW